MRTILGEDDLGEFKVVVEDDRRLTYGPNVPYAKKAEATSHRLEGYSLRIYNGERIEACLTNVKWFRDEKIPIYRVVEKVVSETVWKSDRDGYQTTATKQTTRQQITAGSAFDPINIEPESPKRKKK